MSLDKTQLLERLRDREMTKTRRPILTHVNNDTSWLLSIPVPSSCASSLEKSYFHILIDPWLSNIAQEYPKWIITLVHQEQSACQTIAEVEDLIAAIEEAAAAGGSGDKTAATSKSQIDVVIVSHSNSDHAHKDTMLQIDPSVPVLASHLGATAVKAWNHFESVTTMADFYKPGRDWREAAQSPLPEWLAIFHLRSWEFLSTLHFAIVVAFAAGSGGESEEAEALIYTPHGIYAKDVEPVLRASPPIRTLGLVHGLTTTTYPMKANLGATNGLALQRLTGAKYWTATHDEDVVSKGAMLAFLRRREYTVEEALDDERGENGGKELPNPPFLTVKNGESLVMV